MRHYPFGSTVLRRRISATFHAVLIGALTACGGGDSGSTGTPTGTPTVPTPPAAVASVALTPDSVDVTLGGTRQFAVTVRDAQGASLTGRTVSWSTANATLATVSTSGLVTAVAAGRVLITASAEGRSASAVVRVRVAADTLPGAATALAVTAIPRRAAATRAADYRRDHPLFGTMAVSFNTVLLLIEPNATIGPLNALLRATDATVLGGAPGVANVTPGLLVLRLPTTSHAELDLVMRTLRESPVVRLVVQEVQLETNAISRPSDDQVQTAWTWGPVANSMAQGNWGLKAMRVPQLWNLNDFTRRGGGSTTTGVFDAAFLNHSDMIYTADVTPASAVATPPEREHGTHVAGTIGATFDNGKGIDGVNPFARLVVRGGATVAGLVTGLADFLATQTTATRLRVINISLAYNWGQQGVNTTASATARDLAAAHGFIVEAVLATAQRTNGPLPYIVAAAGNDRSKFPAQQARFASPFNNAALVRGVQAIVVVEAVQLGTGGVFSQAPFSNDGGQLSAPGVDIMSTTPESQTTPSYLRLSGTSMASPNVSGVIGYLLALDPSFPSPTLTSNPMLEVLRATAIPVSAASPRIDAFSAALEMDRVRGGDIVLRGLLDLDDGTPDGSTRVNLESGQVVPGDVTGARDNKVDIRDFRRWRDALLQAENAPALALDGAPDHPKRDLNGDRALGSAAEESAFARSDFNGDGRLSRDATTPMAGVFGATRLTDLQVFQRLFSDADYTADNLPGLIDSGDIEFHTVACLAVPGATSVRASITRGEEETAFRVLDLTPAAPRKIRTEAVFAGGYRARLAARDAQGEEVAFFEQPVSLTPGKDVRIAPECIRLDVEVVFPADVAAGAAQPLSIKVTRVRPRLDLRNPAANADITITVIGGTATNAFGTTNAAGEFNTSVIPAADPSSVTVIIEIDTESGGTSRRITRPISGALACGAGNTTGNVRVRNDAELSLLNSLGRVSRTLEVNGVFTQPVDLRRFCASGINYVVTGTFPAGVRFDGIESVGDGVPNEVVNDASPGVLHLLTMRGVTSISLPRLRYVGIPLLAGTNGLLVSSNPDLLTLTVGRDVTLLEITRFRVRSNPKLTTVTVFPEMRLASAVRFGVASSDPRIRTLELRDNGALTTATFGKVTAVDLVVVNNAVLRTLTLGAGSVIDNTTISGNPLLQAISIPCAPAMPRSITIVGSPRLNVAALQAQLDSCASSLKAGSAPPQILTR